MTNRTGHTRRLTVLMMWCTVTALGASSSRALAQEADARTDVIVEGQNVFQGAGTVEIERPMPRWIAASVAGGGLVLGLASGMLRWRAGQDLADVDDQFDVRCPNGCELSSVPDLEQRRRSAILQSQLGVAGVVVGSAAMLAALGLELWNQPRVRIVRTAIIPRINAEEVGIVARIRF